MRGLLDLPVELFYEIQLFALSASLPLTCSHLYRLFSSAPPSFNAQYVLAAVYPEPFTHILRYPICSEQVLQAICRLAPPSSLSSRPQLPRRLFRTLIPKPTWKDDDHPLPFLRYLYTSPDIPPPDPNSFDGYALTKAVHARFTQLIRFLLDHGASPDHKNGLAVLVAIRQRDLPLVRMLIERTNPNLKTSSKKRKLQDRIPVNSAMLKAAVKCNVRDIIDYLTLEKGCVPDMQTLQMMTR